MKRIFLGGFLIISVFSTLAFAQNALFEKGVQQLKAKQYEQAAATFRQVVARTPNFSEAHFNLGLSLFFMGEYTEAVSAFEQTIRIKPDYSEAYYYLGNTYLQLKLYDDAIENFQKTVQYEPKNADAYYDLGVAYDLQEQFDDAEVALKKAISLKPNDASFKKKLGKVYNELKRYPEAISAFNEALKINPNDADAQLNLGNSYYNDGKYAQAIPFYKKATELLPDSAVSHLYLADAYLYTKQYNSALVSYKKTISLDPNEAKAYYGLGLTYFNLKNNVLARQQLEKLKTINPERAAVLAEKIGSTTAAKTQPTKPVVKSPQRIKDEQDVANMADLGFDAAFVTQTATVRDTPRATGKILLSVKRGDILSLVSRSDSNNWFQVVDEKTGIEGWIDGKAIVNKLTGNEETGPPLLETGAGASASANPVVSITNLEEKTTLRLRINGTLYQIPPQSTKILNLPPGKMAYYGWSPGIRPAIGNNMLERGKQYSWTFKINRR